MQRLGSDIKSDFFWPLAALVLIAIGLFATAGLALVNRFDVIAQSREQNVVENGIHSRVSEVAKMVLPQVVWDDAVANLDNKFDYQWAQENIGVYLNQTNGLEASFVLDANDRPIFASLDGKPASEAKYAAFEADVRPLVAAVRQAESDRRKVLGREYKYGVLKSPIQSSALGSVGDDAYILTATQVQPDFGTARLSKARAPIVVTGMRFDGRFLNAFADRYLLKGVYFFHSSSCPDKSMAYVALRDGHNDLIANMCWTAQNPGQALLRKMGPPIVVLVGLLVVASMLLFRRGRRMTEGLIASEARASHLAYYDSLTGHPNRVLFFDRLGQALIQMRRSDTHVAVHCIDLDRFKEINDTFGHQVGDELIYQAAKRMASRCRNTETFARLSGDEFAIVQPNATVAGAAILASRLCEAMSEPFDLGTGRVYAGCSVGIAMIADSDTDTGEALRQADLALYRAKETAKGQFCFFEGDMDAAVKTRRELETDLREALSREELYLVYQPQVSVNGRMSGVEALIRWDHPTRGPISPAFFIPIAEQSGLISNLGMFALRRAFEDSTRWRDFKIAVNVSATQIRNKDFVDDVRALVQELAVKPSQFELEITEGILLGDDPETQERLAALRAIGFSLALDDFGTGYSSLSYLQRYPIDKIKIDRSFISNLGIDAEESALVGAIVKLARALKLSVIAEGVETDEQLDHLSALGCSEVQGYLFSRPIQASEIDALYANRRSAMEYQ